MRLLIAMMKHETNTFSPVPTPLARFGNGPGPLYGEAAIRAYRGTGTGLGAYLDLAERERAEIVLPIAAGASPNFTFWGLGGSIVAFFRKRKD